MNHITASKLQENLSSPAYLQNDHPEVDDGAGVGAAHAVVALGGHAVEVTDEVGALLAADGVHAVPGGRVGVGEGELLHQLPAELLGLREIAEGQG